MENQRTVLALLWIALMLIYLLGDVIRIFSGSFTSGEMAGKPVEDTMWIAAAVMMVVPIIMIIVSIFLPIDIVKWSAVVVSVLFFLINVVSIGSYKMFDQVLLVISFGINFIIIYFSWNI